MTPINYLCRAAKHAKALRTNYVVVARGSQTVTQGPDLREALSGDVRGAVLYFFCEPSLGELMLATAAGIKAVYYGISKHDAAKYGLFPPSLKPQKIRYCRDEIVRDYVETWNEPVH